MAAKRQYPKPGRFGGGAKALHEMVHDFPIKI
jgi:hypothetical protein